MVRQHLLQHIRVGYCKQQKKDRKREKKFVLVNKFRLNVEDLGKEKKNLWWNRNDKRFYRINFLFQVIVSIWRAFTFTSMQASFSFADTLFGMHYYYFLSSWIVCNFFQFCLNMIWACVCVNRVVILLTSVLAVLIVSK